MQNVMAISGTLNHWICRFSSCLPGAPGRAAVLAAPSAFQFRSSPFFLLASVCLAFAVRPMEAPAFCRGSRLARGANGPGPRRSSPLKGGACRSRIQSAHLRCVRWVVRVFAPDRMQVLVRAVP